jgi:hypothetical protein
MMKVASAEEEVQETDEFDSHPNLKDRLESLRLLAPALPQPGRQAGTMAFDDLDQLAGSALDFVLDKRERGTLKPISWDAVGKTIWEPLLRSALRHHGGPLASVCSEDIRPGNTFFIEMGTALVNQEGDEVPTEDRIERAIQLLTASMAILLVNEGWRLDALPGEPIALVRGEKRFVPRPALRKLADGQLTIEEWRAVCDQVALTGKRLSEGSMVEETSARA